MVRTVLALALLAAPAADAAILRGQALNAQQMQPQVVAMTLARVENDWKAEAGIFSMECNTTTGKGNCKESPAAFAKSCTTVVAAVVQGSGGDRRVAKEYMSNVCNQKQLVGWRKARCTDLASAIEGAMSVDNFFNRESFTSGKLCTSFWSKFVDEERKREEQEALERAQREKVEAEEAAKAKVKAEEEAKKEAGRRMEEEANHAKAEAKAKAEAAEQKAKVDAAEAKDRAAEAAKKLAEKRAEAEKEQKAAEQKLEEAKKAEVEHVKLQAEQKKSEEVLKNAKKTQAPVAVVPQAPAKEVKTVVAKAVAKEPATKAVATETKKAAAAAPLKVDAKVDSHAKTVKK